MQRNRKNYMRISLLYVALLLCAGSASAAQLRIIRTGTGSGDVIGEEIVCGDICRAEYPEKTVAHLKAEAYPDSHFVGWFVNGAPHEGALVIEQDTVVQARFDANTPPDELTVFWYNDDNLVNATVVLDEVVVMFDHGQTDRLSSEEFEVGVEAIRMQFHHDAKIVKIDLGGMLLRRPNTVSIEELQQSLQELRAMPYVFWADMALYDSPKERIGLISLEGERISVDFPANYTEAQIQKIEEDFHLMRRSSYGDFRCGDHCIKYKGGNNAMEAANIARQLYETGLVEKVSIPWTFEWWDVDMGVFALPEDEYLVQGKQWNLYNTTSPEQDIDVESAWEISKGASSLLAILDMGVQITHQDLLPNHYQREDIRDYNYDAGLFNDQYNPAPPRLKQCSSILLNEEQEEICRKLFKHGTNVAGIAVAEGFKNTRGISGVAPQARFVAYRFGNKTIQDSEAINDALTRNNKRVDIYNCSWGWPYFYTTTLDRTRFPNRPIHEAIQSGMGRQGKGNIFVFAAGNGDKYSAYLGRNSNSYNGFANSRYAIAVAASDNNGRASSYSDYGAHILVNAPSGPNTKRQDPYEMTLRGITSTDFTDEQPDAAYVHNLTGTSFAAPIVSGVAALMLAANPALTWRDVQQILIETADKNPGVTWTPNASGNPQYSHDDHLGFGRVNAGKAVKLATTWPPLPQPEIIRQTNANGNAITIPTNLKIEFVEVTFTSPRGHANWGNLEITLYSPQDKSSSVLAEPLTGAKAGRYESWTFGSVRHFGEPSAGAWRLEVKDHGQLLTDFVWTLTIHGTPFPPGLPFNGVYRLKNEDMTWMPDVLPTKDGGYLTVTPSYASGNVLVMKLDAAGGVEWAKTLQGDAFGMPVPHLERTGFYQMNAAVATYLQQAGLSPVAAALQGSLGRKSYASESVFMSHVRRVLQDFGSEAQAALPGILHHALTETGYIIAAGSGAFKDGGLWVINLDTAGNVQWENAYLLDSSDTPRRHEVSMIRRTNDGSYLLAGYIYGINDPYAIQGWLMKLDQDGIPEWNALSTQEMSISAVEELDDGSYVVTGQAGYALAVGQFSADGLPVAGTLRRYPVGGTSWGTRLARADDGGFFLLGGTMGGGMWGFREWDVLLLKFDETLQPIWQRQYGVPDFDEAYALLPTNDGGALVGGGVCVNRNFGSMCAGTQSAWWLKLKDDGEVAGQRTLADGAYSTIRTLAQTRDGGYVGIGEHYHARTGHSIFVVKTAGIETLLTDPARSCFEAGTPPAVQARPVEVAGEPLEMPFQLNPVTHTDTSARSFKKTLDPSSSLDIKVDLCLLP